VNLPKIVKVIVLDEYNKCTAIMTNSFNTHLMSLDIEWVEVKIPDTAVTGLNQGI
jgi:hypothetical protein